MSDKLLERLIRILYRFQVWPSVVFPFGPSHPLFVVREDPERRLFFPHQVPSFLPARLCYVLSQVSPEER